MRRRWLSLFRQKTDSRMTGIGIVANLILYSLHILQLERIWIERLLQDESHKYEHLCWVSNKCCPTLAVNCSFVWELTSEKKIVFLLLSLGDAWRYLYRFSPTETPLHACRETMSFLGAQRKISMCCFLPIGREGLDIYFEGWGLWVWLLLFYWNIDLLLGIILQLKSQFISLVMAI